MQIQSASKNKSEVLQDYINSFETKTFNELVISNTLDNYINIKLIDYSLDLIPSHFADCLNKEFKLYLKGFIISFNIEHQIYYLNLKGDILKYSPPSGIRNETIKDILEIINLVMIKKDTSFNIFKSISSDLELNSMISYVTYLVYQRCKTHIKSRYIESCTIIDYNLLFNSSSDKQVIIYRRDNLLGVPHLDKIICVIPRNNRSLTEYCRNIALVLKAIIPSIGSF